MLIYLLIFFDREISLVSVTMIRVTCQPFDSLHPPTNKSVDVFLVYNFRFEEFPIVVSFLQGADYFCITKPRYSKRVVKSRLNRVVK